MKSNTLTGILMPGILIMLQACSVCQVNSSNQPVTASLPVPENATALAAGNIYRNDIHIRAVRHFKSTCPGVEDEKWYRIDKGFMAKYEVKGVPTRMDYDRRGNWLYTIRYINEKKLPRDVRSMVRSSWYDYAISSAEEIQVANQFIYILHIHEGDDWKLIRVAEGHMMELIPPGRKG